MTEPLHEAVIIGAGFGGIAAAIKLRRAGIDDVLILERANDVGGVWRDNTYPGVAVDIPSFTYSYHFEPNPNWSRTYAPGAELLRYAQDCVEKYGLRPKIRFQANVVAARFDETAHCWLVELSDGTRVRGRYLFSCHGSFATAQQPDIPGLDEFAGPAIYTMNWEHDQDLTGKRVAVIGTGASALQVIPAIAPQVASLTVFQRTPIWVLPRPDAALGAAVRGAFDHVPLVQRSTRLATSALTETVVTFGAVYNRQFPFVVTSVERLCRAFLRAQVPDKVLREKLTPTYGFGCKRPSFSNTYYPTFLRNNVHLVTEGIDAITPTGVRTIDGRYHEIDVLVLATGFKVFDIPYDLYSTTGETLNDLWDRDRMQSYQGTTVRGYPNLFLNPGPYGVAGPSLFTTFELCTTHALRVITAARARGATRVEISASAQEAFLRSMRRQVGNTMFLSPACAGTSTYYIDRHGDAPFLRPTSGVRAWQAQHRFDLRDYEYISATGTERTAGLAAAAVARFVNR